MQSENRGRRRFQTVDGTSFRFEKEPGHLSLNERSLLKVCVFQNSVVELQTEDQQVTVDGVTYWDMLLGNEAPTKMGAGLLLARNDELVGQLRSILDLLVQRFSERGRTGVINQDDESWRMLLLEGITDLNQCIQEKGR